TGTRARAAAPRPTARLPRAPPPPRRRPPRCSAGRGAARRCPAPAGRRGRARSCARARALPRQAAPPRDRCPQLRPSPGTRPAGRAGRAAPPRSSAVLPPIRSRSLLDDAAEYAVDELPRVLGGVALRERDRLVDCHLRRHLAAVELQDRHAQDVALQGPEPVG